VGDSRSAQPDNVIGIEEATALVEVTQNGVQVMIEGGLLNPVGGLGEPRFYRGGVVGAGELDG
jgi:hypothetical protein